jgi:hypothetical protein
LSDYLYIITKKIARYSAAIAAKSILATLFSILTLSALLALLRAIAALNANSAIAALFCHYLLPSKVSTKKKEIDPAAQPNLFDALTH